MSYATRADLIDAFGEDEVIALSDRSNLGITDDALIAKALSDASAEIDGYLQARYPLPLLNVPRLLAVLCGDVARYRMTGSSANATEDIRNRYKDAIKTLGFIRDSKLDLGIDPAGEAPAVNAAVRVSAPARVFGPGTLDQY
ncbi:MAG: hypothetical protein JWL63_3208 [Rhodocyclales bacterium]|nr:hypothetical protein [Rhodocyclales bacterium]